MKRALLHLQRVYLSIRHLLPVFLFTLVSLIGKAQCPPTITPTPASANICSGDSVLMDCTPATGTTWQWYKNGAVIPGAVNSSCYAYDAGNYTVKIGSCATMSDVVVVTTKPLPFILINPSATTICAGQQVMLNVSTGPNVTWVWIEPISLFGKVTNPVTVTLNTPTQFQVVGANMSTNCASTSKVLIQVDPPLIPGKANSDSQICPGEIPPLLTATASTGGSGTYEYQWQVSITGAGSGFQDIPGATTLTYQPGATFQTTWYRVATTSEPCQDEYTNVITVQVNPNPTVTSAGTKDICTGDNTNYHTRSNVAGTTFAWTASVTSGTVSGVSPSGSGDINDVLSLPAGASTTGEVTYVITPTGPAPTNCPGIPKNLVVTVNPIPTVSNAILSQNICSGTTTTAVVLTSNVAGTTYSWTSNATPGLSGYQASGNGNIPARQIFSTLLVQGSVKYTITPHGPGASSCDGPSVVYTIYVDPSPIVTNNPMQQTICTDDKTTAVTLTSNIASTTFTWTATANPATMTGFQASGTNTIPVQTISNNSNAQGTITYHIIPSNSPGGCIGIPDDYMVYVNPKPVVSVAQTVIALCSGTTTNIVLSSNVAGTTFSWTASSPGSVSGHSDGNGNLISQTLTNISNATHPVHYVITPTFNGCKGDDITVTVNVNPAQTFSLVPANPTVCSGNNVMINLVGNVPGINFSWTASTTGNVTGFSDGTGSTISQTLTNNDNITRTVVYAVMMELNGCSDGPVNFNVTVYPTPSVTNSPLTSTRCSGTAFNLALTSSVSGTSYNWTANGTPGTSGFSGGSGTTINQTVTTTANATGSVIYTITPVSNGCNGPAVDYTLSVNPIPVATLSLNNQSICSSSSTAAVTFTSPVAGTTYTWTAVPSGAGISGYTASGSASIPSQTINSTLTVSGTVNYTVLPTYSGCSGPSVNHLVTVNPQPSVTNASMLQTICSGASSSNVNLLSNVAGTTFAWTALPALPSITGYQSTGGNSIPSQTIFNSGTAPSSVTYQITPTANSTPTCPGAPANYVITVNPKPVITSSLAEAICSGQTFNYSITSNIPGSTFNWTRAAVSGISNAPGTGNTSSINETLLNTTNNDIDVTYVLTPYGQAPTNCAGPSVNLIVKVRALPQVNAGADFTIPYGTYTTLNGTASGGTGSLSYNWTPITYINSGATILTPQTEKLILTRTYSLTVNDVAGCTANDAITVFVVGAPVSVSPTAIPSSICLGQSTTLSANASGGSGTYTYLWSSVPAGYTSASASDLVSPNVTTVYTVTVNDGFNTASASVTVTVNPLPNKYALTGGGSYCSGGPGVVVGLANSQSGVTYQLYNNSTPVGSPVSGTGSAISFGNQTLSGIYTVSATRISTGCTIDMGSSVLVSINPLPTANAGTDQVIPYGTSTTLNGTSSGGFGTITYSWLPLASIATGDNTNTPKTTNIYSNTTYTLKVTDGNGCAGSDQVEVSLNGNALNVVVASVPASICADASTAQLPASPSGGSGSYTYSWTCTPAGSPAWTSTEQNPTVSPDVTTTYTVTVNDGFNTANATVTVLSNPLPLHYSVVGGGSYCYAGNGVSIGMSGSEPNTNYQLYRGGFADGPAITGTGAPISFGTRTAAFNYTVQATNNFTGCSNVMDGSSTILILPPPTAYLVTGGGSYPSGGNGREVGSFRSDAGVSYQLYCNNLPIGAPAMGTGSALSFGLQTQPGTYTVEATDISSGCSVLMTASVDVSILPFPLSFTVYGGGVICDGQPGLFVHLTGSEVSIDYQLLRNGFPYGPIVAGTNAPLTWGPFTVGGLYEVRSINSTVGITKMMDDSAVIIVHPAPKIYTMDPTGTQCPGTIIRLNGSQAGMAYYLLYNGLPVDTITGTGEVGFLDFGPQTISGTYTVKAVNLTTGCDAMMNGSTFITIAPEAYNVIPAGILCPGQTIGLSGSETGVNYQLRWNGTFDLGAPVAGTGSALAIGSAGLPGIYSVIATNATTNCVTYMNDSSTLYPDPTAFTITPDGESCEGDIIGMNGSEPGVDYVLLLDNAIHVDTISGNGSPISFGPQFTAGKYTIIAINQTSYCIFPMNGATKMNDSPIKYSLLPAGIQCIGTSIGLSGSQPGITYQLMLNSTFNMGAPVAGTGSALSFGPQSLPGIYTIRATNNLTGCNTLMSDSAVLEPLPAVFTTAPAGSHCAGSSIGLNGSELNFNYILILDGAIHLDTIPGTGNAIDFGPQPTSGTYTVLAYNKASLCSNLMDGNSIIEASPVAYAMTPAGIACIGSAIGLESSQAGINYQLRWNGSINVGPAVAGTGSAISFGTQNLTGTYTVIATNPHGCFSTMNSPVVINPLPVAFNVIPAGTQCQGTSLGTDGSEIGINYVLVRNGNVMVDTIPGTGSTITFGPQLTSGTYTVMAYFAGTSCPSAMNGNSIISDIAPTIYTMTPAGIICSGAIIGIDNSEIGATYQLRLNGTINMGVPVAGTGSPIDFGAQTLQGVYTAIATNQKGCSSVMSGSVVMNPNPTAFNIVPSAGHCPGITVGIDGSETGVNYILILDNSIYIDTLSGTGSALSFGLQYTSGTYTVMAYNAATLCRTVMNGTTVIHAAPVSFNMTPAGINCSGTTLGLDNSEIGVSYQLRWNGNINIGSLVAGTGSPISFGSHTLPGTYTVIANNADGCVSTMNSSVEINPLPVAFNIIPSGIQCQGTSLGLDGSEVNVNYVLVLNGMIMADTVTGTGSAISFGPQMTSGIYTVVAYNVKTNCQSTMNGISIISNVAPAIYTMTPAGIICSGSVLGLDNSEPGATYQLRSDGTINVGSPVAGTGSAISFGVQTIPGVYTAIATNSNGCNSLMTGSVVLNPNPVAYQITPNGIACQGSIIGIDGSEAGINYVLLLNGAISIDTLAGNGSELSFGQQTTSGTYTVLAINNTTLCKTVMNGVTTLNAAPVVYNLTPAGVLCSGANLGIDGSDVGVLYQLRRDGTVNVGSQVAGTGSPISFGMQYLPGTYTVEAAGLNGCPAMMKGSAVINSSSLLYNIDPVGNNCPGTDITLNGSDAGINYILYRDGIFAIDTLAGTGLPLNFGAPMIAGTYTIAAKSSTSQCQVMMNGSTVIMISPSLYHVTPAGIICGSAVAGLDGSETGVSYTLFKNGSSTGITVAGTGSAISFGLVTFGNYTVKGVNQTTLCSSTMTGSLLISTPPQVNLGSDVTICSPQSVVLNATVSDGGTSSWLTSGDGTFHNTGTLHPMYTPGPGDIANGHVSLMLTVDGTGTCSSIKVTDTLTLTIDRPAKANAGPDIDVCTINDYTVHASATNYKTITWTTSGTGNFSNGGSLTPTYHPSAADLAAGSVNLTMQVTANSPCGNVVKDAVMMSFHPLMSVDAGPGATISHFNTFTATQASVQNATSVKWSTSGTGSFDDASLLHATYLPGETDYAKGSVILTLAAFGNSPCGPANDTLTLKFINNWSVDYSWKPSCEDAPVHFTINTGVTNIGATSGWLWNFGDGSTSTLMEPTHLFAGTGEFEVTLTAKDTIGKVNKITHHVTISQYPVSFFSNSIPDCSNAPMHFKDLSHTLYGYIAQWVWNYGDGSANDTVNFPNDPNLSHLFGTAGIFDVALTVTNSFGCSTSATIPVKVIEAPVTNFQYYNNCKGLETSFKDASYANGPGNTIQYWWNFGDPSTGTDNYSDKKDATHIFSKPGSYQVMHVVRNFNNCTDTIVKTVNILLPVPVDFVHSRTCIDGISSFGPDASVMNIPNITRWDWNFGDGAISNLQNTTHIFTQPGSNQVTLTVEDISGCTASITRTIVVNPLPVSMFNVTQHPCANVPAQFENVSNTYAGFITKWNWDFGDGITKEIHHPSNPSTEHAYATPGTYTVTLLITSSDSCTAISQQTIVVNPAPVANFAFDHSCQGTAIQFSDLTQTSGGGAITSWNWNFGNTLSGSNNVSTLQNPEHVYNSIGIYQVTLTASTANGCSSTFAEALTISRAPAVDFTFTSHCVDAAVKFSPTTATIKSNITALSWLFGDGLTSDQPYPQHVYEAPGDYLVTLTVTNTSGCQSTISHQITILPAPVAKFNTSSPACSGNQVLFNTESNATTGSILRWEYQFGDGTQTIVTFPDNPNVTHSYAASGTYEASLKVVTDNGCSATTLQNVEVLASPLANFDISNACLGAGAQFNDLSQGKLVNWAWDFGDSGSGTNNNSTKQNAVHTYLQAGNYLVTLRVDDASGCYDTVVRNLNISTKPAADFSFNNGCASDTVHFNSSNFASNGSISSWAWSFGDNSTSVEADPYHIYVQPGTYPVSLTITNQNGCTNVKTRKVLVTTAPTAMFTHNSLSCSGTAVLFTDLSSTSGGVIDSWNWSFDDGTSVTVTDPSKANVSRTFASPGIYQVTLGITTSTGCYASYSTGVKVTSAPETAFSFSNGCDESPTSFTDQTQASGGYAITAWNWNFGDPSTGMSNTSSLQNPKHLFSGKGTFTVSLTTENSAGCSNSLTRIISIRPGDEINFNVSPACDGTPAAFILDTTITDKTEVTSYLWDFGDGTVTSTLAEPSHLFAQTGNYKVTLTLTKTAGCKSSVTKTVTIHKWPVALFATSGSCAMNEVKFKDMSYSPDGDKILGWAWDFGVNHSTSDTSTAQNPAYVYNATGSYPARLTITTASGCTAVKVLPVSVIPAPEAQFSYVAEPCHNGSALFTDKSVSTQSMITSWYWEFAPGIYSTLQNPVHVFGDTDTCYNVTLTVTTANGCSNTLVKRICIPPALKVDINYTQACFGGTTWFTSTLLQPADGTISSYKWNFGDQASGYNNESKIANPQHTFSKTGTFVVSLQVFDKRNCSTTKYMSITVDALPQPDFSYSGGSCDSLIKFKDESSGVKIARWIWKFGDGKYKIVTAPANPNVSHYYTYPGVYQATLITESEAGCYDTIVKTVRRTPCIRAAFAVNDPVVCQKRSMKFTETSTCEAPIATWQWFFGDGTSAIYNEPQPYIEHTYAAAGNYKVKMVVATEMVGGLATDTASSQVAVNPAAKAAYAWHDACVGTSTTFKNLSTNNNTTIKGYQWNFGNAGQTSDNSASTDAEYNYKLPGQYDVKLVVTNTLGCTDTISQKVNIFASPAADFAWNTNCEAKPVHFNDISEPATSAITSWNWKFGTEAQVLDACTKRSCSVTFAHAGTYEANLKVTDRNGCSTTATKQITVASTPVAAFNIVDKYENKQGQIQLSNGTVNGTDYFWDFGDGKTSFAASPTITFDREGHYIIQLVAFNGKSCSDTTTLEYDLMFKGLYVPNAFNPGHDDPEVAVFKPKGLNLKMYHVEIYDRWGNLLWNSSKLDENGSPAESWDGTFNGQLLSADVYVWKISAQFMDGEVWDGTNAGNNENLTQTKAGTVTLIR